MCYIYILRDLNYFSLSFFYILLHYLTSLEQGEPKEKKEFDVKEKKTLHSSTVFWDLGLLEFIKADGFPVVRKG